MNTENKDIDTLLELLKMETERWPDSDELTQGELFGRDRSLLEMWPEACRRTGVGKRHFRHEVLKLWKQRAGMAH
jgi:hypothetical protein